MHYMTKILFINCFLVFGAHGMDMDTREDGENRVPQAMQTALNSASDWSDKKALIHELITKHRIHPNSITYYASGSEKRPLHEAAFLNDLEFVKFLLESGADINMWSYDPGVHEGPVLFCARSTQMAQLLLHNKASVNARGGRGYESMPLLCCSSVQFGDASPELIALYGQHGVDASAVAGDGASPLHGLIFSTTQKKRLEIAQKLIEIGVSLDAQKRCSTWGTMTFIKQLRVKIKKEANEVRPDQEEMERDLQLLEGVRKAVIARNARTFTQVHRMLPKDPAGIVLSYYVDQEKFDQADAEIEVLARQVVRRQEANARESFYIDWMP